MSDWETKSVTYFNSGFDAGVYQERERITKLLNQLENEWRDRLAYNLIKDNSYETSRYRNYVLACADFRDAVIDPEILIKGKDND